MSDRYEGDVFLLIQFYEQLTKLVGGGLIQCSGGLVGQQEFGLVYQRANNSHALAFSTRELAGPVGQAFAKIYALEKALAAFFVRGSSLAVGKRGHEHILHHSALR